jgi:hypothetical protein
LRKLLLKQKLERLKYKLLTESPIWSKEYGTNPKVYSTKPKVLRFGIVFDPQSIIDDIRAKRKVKAKSIEQVFCYN